MLYLMKVFVCRACTCQVELLLEKNDSCLIVFCGKVIYNVFTAFFRFGEKTESWDSLHVEVKLRQICVCTRTTYLLNLRILLNLRFSQDSLVESWMQILDSEGFLDSTGVGWLSVRTRIPYQDLHTLSPKTNIHICIYIYNYIYNYIYMF